ncbi:MAG: hypothetical protein JHC95_05060 [Solirubrobacteraceae bacterium]|nr:hypothetical protein [Solirubrobacteraceae bacterium]
MAVLAPTAAPTATGTTSGNVDGQAIAITVFSTVKWWGRAWLPAVFIAPKVLPKTLDTLKTLSFIHFARWTLIRELPHNGAPQPSGKLRYPHLYFESNFNGGWEEYIDAFSHILTRGMWTFWGSSYGFPKALPTGPFKAYIKANEIEACHFYSAYPEATTTQIRRAIELEPMVADLRARAEGMSPEEFSEAFGKLVSEGQRCF